MDHARTLKRELAEANACGFAMSAELDRLRWLLSRMTAVVELRTSGSDDEHDRALRPLIAVARAALAKNLEPHVAIDYMGLVDDARAVHREVPSP